MHSKTNRKSSRKSRSEQTPLKSNRKLRSNILTRKYNLYRQKETEKRNAKIDSKYIQDRINNPIYIYPKTNQSYTESQLRNAVISLRKILYTSKKNKSYNKGSRSSNKGSRSSNKGSKSSSRQESVNNNSLERNIDLNKEYPFVLPEEYTKVNIIQNKLINNKKYNQIDYANKYPSSLNGWEIGIRIKHAINKIYDKFISYPKGFSNIVKYLRANNGNRKTVYKAIVNQLKIQINEDIKNIVNTLNQEIKSEQLKKKAAMHIANSRYNFINKDVGW